MAPECGDFGCRCYYVRSAGRARFFNSPAAVRNKPFMSLEFPVHKFLGYPPRLQSGHARKCAWNKDKTTRRRKNAGVARVSALRGVFSGLSVSIAQQQCDASVKIHSGKTAEIGKDFRPSTRTKNGALRRRALMRRAWQSDGRAATPCGGRRCDGRCPSGRRE